MAWAKVDVIVPAGVIENAINIDNVCRFGPIVGGTGCYIQFVDGNTIEVAEYYKDLITLITSTKGA